MAYLQIKSTNPNLSYILRKNPASGMLIKENRKGRLFAWYTDPQTFNIYFRDSDTEVSYGKGDSEFEYMDETRYSAPLFLVNAFTEFLNHMKKLDEKDTPGYENTLMINLIKCKQRSLKGFIPNFTDYEFDFDEVNPSNYNITIKTNRTLMELVSMGNILSIFNGLLNDDIEAVSDSDIDKYMNWIRIVDAPYYIRHLFSIYFLKSEKIFSKYKQMLETTDRSKYEFEFGSNIRQRIRAIKKYMDNFKSSIVDIGCGDGEYVREFAPRLSENLEYHAIDTKQEEIEKVKRLCERKQIENVAIWSSLDEFVNATVCSNYIILMTEVIEHMSKEEAAVFLTGVLKLPYKKIIITTPNKEFNPNYKLFDEDVRNNDHKFEMTKEEFRDFITDVGTKYVCTTPLKPGLRFVDFFEIGDKVNGIQPTLGAVIE